MYGVDPDQGALNISTALQCGIEYRTTGVGLAAAHKPRAVKKRIASLCL